MDPAANQVARGNKWTRAPQLGDLVLAKVKGYPFWPAKVSRPEDWNQEPAPRKFFVLFFGTREIAFVALHDLLPFTEEVKSDLVNQAREKRFPKRHAKGLEEALVEVQKAYDELPKSSETSNGLFPNRTPDPIEKPTEPLVKPPTDGWTPKLEQIDDFDGRYLSLKREERDVPKSSETANGLLHDQTPDPVEKPTEPLVKPPTDGGTTKLEQIDDFDGRYPSLKRKERDVPKSSETANGLLRDRTPDPIEKPTEPLVKQPAELEQTDDFHERYLSLKREERDVPKSSETANGLLHDRTPDPIEKTTEPLVKQPAELEQTDDFHGRYLSLKREERDVPKSSETANGLLHDRTPDLIEKPTEPLVKQPADGGTPKLEQTDDSHARYPSLKSEKRVRYAGIEERNLEDPYGIPRCIAALEGLPDLQMEDVLKAADLFTDNKGNREVFLSFQVMHFGLVG
ncbi:uncharacterized protein [Aegilops tauschii subsp. strangulata]|uniref:PWWP domain-containing protein n=1 Tax=Aegilops tauschii subsp. strangulata TaxID=200361 RepID=A0A453S8U2_AEGTS|nr:ENHANCER OF AG-4 protein 2 [Aegilops tauschii subsp. strangulata]